jgi:hypothetical protein
MMVCNHGYFDEKKALRCNLDDMVCLHIKYCQLTMKWSQTDSAIGCLKPEMIKEERNEQTG